MAMKTKMKYNEDEIIKIDKTGTKRYPNLATVIMVENFLKSHRDVPMKVSEIRQKLSKQIMHQTLLVILEYLWISGKVIYGPKGVQWIYSSPEHLKKMFEGTLEV